MALPNPDPEFFEPITEDVHEGRALNWRESLRLVGEGLIFNTSALWLRNSAESIAFHGISAAAITELGIGTTGLGLVLVYIRNGLRD